MKQSAHVWNQLLSKTLIDLGYLQLVTDPTCFIKVDDQGTCIILAAYVDDLVIMGRTLGHIKAAKDELKEKFKVKDLGEINWLLGVSIERDTTSGTLTMHQHKYITDMVHKFGQEDSAPVTLPHAGGDDRQPTEVSECDQQETSRYRSIVGSLLYAAVATRPDICETVGRLCRSMKSPTTADMKKAIRCIRYLKGTSYLGIQFSRESGLKFYCDSNWGGPTERRLSRTGYAAVLNNGAIIFRSLMQKSQALSSAEAEYIALCAATQDAVYLTQMLQEHGMDLREPVLMLEDNQACIQLADKNMASPRLKHVDIRYHYVRTMVQEKKIEIIYCPTYHQAADILTKPVDQLTFLRHRATLMGLPNRA